MKDCSNLTKVPITDVYLPELGPAETAMLCVAGALTLFVIIVYLEELTFFARKMGHWKPKDKAIKLLLLYPLTCSCSYVAILVPRSSTLNDTVIAMYLAMCVYLFVVMLMGHFGGLHKMTVRLAGFSISLAASPLCCCRCLPSVQTSTTALQLLQISVLQWVIIKPILSYVSAVIWTNEGIDESLHANSPSIWIDFIDILSSTLALYGFTLTYRLGRSQLVKMTIKPKFVVLQSVIVITTFQPVVLDMLAVFNAFPCNPPLSRVANAKRWNHFLYIIEMAFLSLVARYYYRRHVGDADLEPEDRVNPGTRSAATSFNFDNVDTRTPISKSVGGRLAIHNGRSASLPNYGSTSNKYLDADYGLLNILVRRERKRQERKSKHQSSPHTGSFGIDATGQVVDPNDVTLDMSFPTDPPRATSTLKGHVAVGDGPSIPDIRAGPPAVSSISLSGQGSVFSGPRPSEALIHETIQPHSPSTEPQFQGTVQSQGVIEQTTQIEGGHLISNQNHQVISNQTGQHQLSPSLIRHHQRGPTGQDQTSPSLIRHFQQGPTGQDQPSPSLIRHFQQGPTGQYQLSPSQNEH